jgi:exopolysaccharide biosynthesis polyprenyl glycosylphosphotransferase
MTARQTVPRISDEVIVLPNADPDSAQGLTGVVVPADGKPVDGSVELTVGTNTLARYRFLGFLLLPLDVLCLTAALIMAHALRFGVAYEWQHLAQIALGGLLWPAVFHALGLYTPHLLPALEEFRRTIIAVGIGIVLLILLTFWTNVYLHRSWIAITFGIALVLELATRIVVRRYVARLRATDSLTLRTVVIGNGDQVLEPLETLGQPGSGFLPVGWIDADSPIIASESVSATERVKRFRSVFRQYRPDCVFMASTTIGRRQMLALMQAARQEGVVVRIYTHLSGVLASRLTAQLLGKEGVVLSIKPAGLSASQRFIKRGIDIVLASIGLIVSSPVTLVAAIAIRVTSGSPVLFKQQRVTDGARTFSMYKLRTMTNGAQRIAEAEGIDTSLPFFKLKGDDPRLTTVGKILRRWSIDELPQLFNVLIGDMSLVGPRPLTAEQVSANIELLGPRHEVRSGITGWWQVEGRSDIEDHEDAIRLDHFYIENWSPILDAYILLRTVGAVLARRGAY